jgi:hypothetical protein
MLHRTHEVEARATVAIKRAVSLSKNETTGVQTVTSGAQPTPAGVCADAIVNAPVHAARQHEEDEVEEDSAVALGRFSPTRFRTFSRGLDSDMALRRFAGEQLGDLRAGALPSDAFMLRRARASLLVPSARTFTHKNVESC